MSNAAITHGSSFATVSFCCRKAANSFQELAAFLQQNETVANDDPCVIAALDILGQERATAYIPELIKFLEFRRKFYWEGTSFKMQPVTEIDHYPAAMALFQMGKPALPALLAVIAQEKP